MREEKRGGEERLESSVGRAEEVIGADPHPQGLFAICNRRKWRLRGRWENRSRGVLANEEERGAGMVGGGATRCDTTRCNVTQLSDHQGS